VTSVLKSKDAGTQVKCNICFDVCPFQLSNLTKGVKQGKCAISGWRSRDSVVGIATGYGLDDRGVGVRVLVGSRIFSSPRRPDLLSNGYRGLFHRG
jgi:hypothetical protein